jgi:hypothetical protein
MQAAVRSLLLMPLGGSSTAVTRSRFSTYEYRCYSSRTTNTGQCACRKTASDTLPVSALLIPPTPRAPITIRPAPISSAKATISAAGRPVVW